MVLITSPDHLWWSFQSQNHFSFIYTFNVVATGYFIIACICSKCAVVCEMDVKDRGSERKKQKKSAKLKSKSPKALYALLCVCVYFVFIFFYQLFAFSAFYSSTILNEGTANGTINKQQHIKENLFFPLFVVLNIILVFFSSSFHFNRFDIAV